MRQGEADATSLPTEVNGMLPLMIGYLRIFSMSCMLIVWTSCVFASDTVFRLLADDWSRPRNGHAVTRLPGLSEAMQDYMRNPHRLVRIRHPEGEDGLLWAEELRAWLVAFGIESTRVDLLPGMGLAGVVEITLISGL